MDDDIFNEAEEDLHFFYHKRGKVDKEMELQKKNYL